MYEKLLDMNNLYNSFQKCKKNVGWKCSVQRYDAMVLSNLNILRKQLKDHTYKQKPFYEFDINERGKPRHIKALSISDRIVQRTLCDYILMPELKKYLIYDNGASIKGKGVSFSRNRVKTHLQKFYRENKSNDGYVLTIDFSKYFDNIQHDKLIKAFDDKIADKEVMELIKYIIETFSDSGKSIGIGSQLSQIAGLIFPVPLDNYCKIVKGCKYYGRFNDDIYIVHQSKEFLKNLFEDIKKICDELGIIINPKKTHICKLKNGFTYLKIKYILCDNGYVVMKPCKKTFVIERKKLKKLYKKWQNNERDLETIVNQYKTWRGNLSKFNCYKSLQSMDNLFKQLFTI